MNADLICTLCGNNQGTMIIQGGPKQIVLCEPCMKKKGFNPEEGIRNMDELLGIIFGVQNEMETVGSPQTTEKTKKTKKESESDLPPVLQQFCVDITLKAKKGEMDPVVGRTKEIERMITILNRKQKNNPVLLGEAGVGKTAVVEGLALRIVQEKVPFKLKNKKILSVSMSDLTAGTMYRGMFEDRMKKLIEAVEERSDIILFIDELHTMMGAGAGSDSKMDAANILKPALARGKFRVIGATTLDEYRHIEKDPALERRFQIVRVEEPNVEDTITILKGLRSNYEKFHEINYSDEAVEACVRLADRYIFDRKMPDKAIDLMDEIGAKLNLVVTNKKEPTLEEKMAKALKLQEKAVFNEDFTNAAKYRTERLKLEEALAKEKENPKAPAKKMNVTVEQIEQIVEEITGIPVTQIAGDQKDRLRVLEESLRGNVVGQENAVKEVAKAIKRNRLGIRQKKKPSSFLFAGPTGVGKTELTKQIAKQLFGSDDALIRLDMSEYTEEHSVSKIIGAPPGYVGYEKAGGLTEKVRRRPYSVILLDEFEKAHSNVARLFLQVFDEGRLTDAQGRVVDFTNTIIVMTSNLGAVPKKTISLLEQKEDKRYLEAVKDKFPPEFINRLDAIVPFESLSENDLVKIVDLMLKEIVLGSGEKGIELIVTDEAKKWLAKKGFDPQYGARPLQRTIVSEIEDRLTDYLLETETPAAKITVEIKDNLIVLI
jgi:ATP-dependent Clp protease ATP-binding subunit ClpE